MATCQQLIDLSIMKPAVEQGFHPAYISSDLAMTNLHF
jgi:hypothetical protein